MFVFPSSARLIAAALCSAALGLSACGANVEAPDPNPTPHDVPQGPGLFSGASGNILDGFGKNRGGGGLGATTNLGVNSYLWRATLESVGFMPLITADSNGGVITTDWYTRPDNPTERVRANVLIMGTQLRADALEVKLFKQQQINGQWQDVVVDEATTRQLEDVILTKARALRVQDAG